MTSGQVINSGKLWYIFYGMEMSLNDFSVDCQVAADMLKRCWEMFQWISVVSVKVRSDVSFS